MNRRPFAALGSMAWKEGLHVMRDWRILLLLLIFPPVFTLVLGHAFEAGELAHVPTVLRDEDRSPESARLLAFLEKKPAFAWQIAPEPGPVPDLVQAHVQGAVTIPPGWGAGLADGRPLPLAAVLNGTDTATAPALQGALEQALGEFQLRERDHLLENLPEEMLALGEKIPADFRSRLVSTMEPWSVRAEIRYNPRLRFVDFVAPGLVGIILQLLTIPLMAVTLTRERENGTLAQLLLTSLRHWEIVVGKVLPHLLISGFMVAVVMGLCAWHFAVPFRHGPVLAGLCALCLLCSLGLGLVISALCQTQAQAVQVAVFFLVPIIPLSGAFAPLEQLPPTIQQLAQIFPLTHFCRAFRLVNLADAPFRLYAGDVAFLALGALVTFAGAALLLRRVGS